MLGEEKDLLVVVGAVEGIEGLVDLGVVPLDGGDSALAEGLHGAGLLGAGLGRGAAAVARSGSGRGDCRARLLRGDVSSRCHFDFWVWVDLRWWG